jgi:hypothetical protein
LNVIPSPWIDGNARKTAVTGGDGTVVLDGIASGPVTRTATLSGFAEARTSFTFDGNPRGVDVELGPARIEETVTVMAESPAVEKDKERAIVRPSQNVVNLQRRAAGVLPVRVDVPRAGRSHRSVKPLMVDQEAFVTLRYSRRR